MWGQYWNMEQLFGDCNDYEKDQLEKVQILHMNSKLRMQCSDIHEDLFNKGLTDSPMCRCGDQTDDAEQIVHVQIIKNSEIIMTDALDFNIFFKYDIDILL